MASFAQNPQRFLEDLNPAQREAVEAIEGPVLVTAGAGSGKTRVITYRIAWTVARLGVPVGQILAVTFTNKAASEMRKRALALLGLPESTPVSIGTFHSRCASILRRESARCGLSDRFQILDEDDQIAVIKRVIQQFAEREGCPFDPKKVKPSQIVEVISRAKQNMLGPDDIRDLDSFQNARIPYPELYAAYQEILERSDAVDFDDLLVKVVRLWEEHPESLAWWRRRYPFVLVDEYQDTNAVQFRLLELLAGEHRNLCVVGDEDQSIYSWRGADIRNLLEFQEHFPEARIIRLERNYRSTPQILAAAASVIQRNRQRLGKTLYTEDGDGPLLRFHRAIAGEDEAQWVVDRIREWRKEENIPLREFAVFYRINALSRATEDALRRARIPYRIVGGLKFYERKEIKDLLAFLRLAVNPENDVAFLRVLNVPRRGLGKAKIEAIVARATRERRSLYEAARALLAEGEIRGAAAGALGAFLDLLGAWRAIHASMPPGDLLKRVLADTRYIEEELGDPKSLEAITRTENIKELQATLNDFQKANPDAGILAWLEEMALTTASDTSEGDSEGVSLMTLHSAKGLEFNVVFLIGMEEGLFPLQRSIDEQGHDEEERRLFYVGITRARRRLALSCAISRHTYGAAAFNLPSPFLQEINPELFERGESPGECSRPHATSLDFSFSREKRGWRR